MHQVVLSESLVGVRTSALWLPLAGEGVTSVGWSQSGTVRVTTLKNNQPRNKHPLLFQVQNSLTEFEFGKCTA